MTTGALLAALNLPAGSRVNQRIPRTVFEHGAPTAADKRHINEGVELLWLASLKPTTIGVPEYRDDVRDLEIAVLGLTLRAGAKPTRLVELVHRAVPYPLLLLIAQEGQAGVSAAHIRRSQGQSGETVLDGDIVSIVWNAECDGERWSAFLDALALSKQPRTSIHALYQGWIDTLLALQAARVTGAFAVAANAEQAVARRDALRECARLDAKIARLRSAAAREADCAASGSEPRTQARRGGSGSRPREPVDDEDTMQKLTAEESETKS